MNSATGRRPGMSILLTSRFISNGITDFLGLYSCAYLSMISVSTTLASVAFT